MAMADDGEKEVLEYRFGDGWRVVPGLRLMLHHGQPVEVAQRTLDVLLVLLQFAGQPVSNPTIMKLAWRGINIAHNNIVIHVGHLRRLLGPASITVIMGFGYQCTMEVVVVYKEEAAAQAAPEPAETPPDPDAISHGPARPVNVLPHYLDSMLGRDDDLAKVTALLGENRVVTLRGPGGIGKTRVAGELGRRLIPRFPGGVKLIDLAPVKEPAGVAGAVASALGVTQRSSEALIEAIAKRLGKQPCLLIFDTCERMIDPLAELIATLAPRVPNLSVLATSQRRFKVPLGKLTEVGGLPVPLPEATAEPEGSAARIGGYGAVQLFVDRVSATDDRFELTDKNSAAVAEICRRVGGNPLSLELAAGRVRGLRIDGVLARLDRLPAILNKGSPVGPERHVSLSNLLDWSYGTLNAAEQAAFCRLGIFPADFSADAGLTVIRTDDGDDSADLLFDLVDACMVRSEDSAEPRYRLHETM